MMARPLYGARLTAPPGPAVETQTIGRGAMNALNGCVREQLAVALVGFVEEHLRPLAAHRRYPARSSTTTGISRAVLVW